MSDLDFRMMRAIPNFDHAIHTSRTALEARLTLVIFTFLAIGGLALGWNKGQLPIRENAAPAPAGQPEIAPDLALYRYVIAEVRGGRNYYEIARQQIPHYGFPIASPLNWRLPTYAWLLSRLPGQPWIQATLVALSIMALWLAYVAQSKTSGVGYAAVTTLLLFGVVRWAIDGQAYLAQEPWAATLIIISLSAHALGGERVGNALGNQRGPAQPNDGALRSAQAAYEAGWRSLAVAAGTLALLFRELALPYCVAAWLLAVSNRRWREAAGWTCGIALFFGFYAWHVSQVKAQLAGTEIAQAAGLSQWLRFGGLDFVLLTTRMNGLLFAAPAWLLWLFVLAALLGLARRSDASNQLACLAALGYLLAFAFVGRPENFYWGLMAAPLLAWGAAHGVYAVKELCQSS
jgi:hypothetical protein